MQKECAQSFIKPLEMELINKRNKEKICKAAVQIITDDDNKENESLIDAWMKVLETCVSRVDSKFINDSIIEVIKNVAALKNPLPKRKLGNRLIFAVAKNVGEEGLDKNPTIMKLVSQVMHDNNYKIRRDGVIFLRDYMKANKKEIVESERFKEVYLEELIDFLNDEDIHI